MRSRASSTGIKMLLAIPTLLLMIVTLPFGFLYEAFLTGFIAGRGLFDELSNSIKNL